MSYGHGWMYVMGPRSERLPSPSLSMINQVGCLSGLYKVRCSSLFIYICTVQYMQDSWHRARAADEWMTGRRGGGDECREHVGCIWLVVSDLRRQDSIHKMRLAATWHLAASCRRHWTITVYIPPIIFSTHLISQDQVRFTLQYHYSTTTATVLCIQQR